MFVSIDGIDGAGKTTLAEELCRFFKEKLCRACIVTREPGGTEIGEDIRKLAKGKKMEPLTLALLMIASRHEHFKRIIMPSLAKGVMVVCDRWVASTYAYQGAGMGVPGHVLREIDSLIKSPAPDVQIWLDVHPVEGRARAQQNDMIGGGDLDMLRRAHQAFGQMGLSRIDGGQSPQKVLDDAIKLILDVEQKSRQGNNARV